MEIVGGFQNIITVEIVGGFLSIITVETVGGFLTSYSGCGFSVGGVENVIR